MHRFFLLIKIQLIRLWQYRLQRVIACVLNFILPSRLIDAIVIESHNDFDGNGGAIYNYLIKKECQKRYTIVLFLGYKLDRNLPKGVIALRKKGPSLRRAYYMCRAKYLLADDSFHRKYKLHQITVYLTHGIPIKNTYGIIKLFPSTNYCLSPSEWFDPYVRKAFTIENTLVKLIHLGYPRLDILYEKSERELPKVTSKIFRKKVIWMPTFRKGGGIGRNDADYDLPLGVPLLNTNDDVVNLNVFLAERDMLLIVKIHPKQDGSTVKIKPMSNILVLTLEDVKKKHIDNFRLYKDMDAMVSDYSSASFDFMHLDRPICFDFSDLNHYKLGLIMENPDDFLPGDKVYDIDGLKKFLEDVSNGVDAFSEKRREVFDKLFEYHDGNSCERIANFLGI